MSRGPDAGAPRAAPSVRRNIAANAVATAWTAVATLAATPLFLHKLGADAFGLLAIFTILQAALALLDAGLAPALGRFAALYVAGERSPMQMRDLILSVERTIFVVAAALFVLFALAAPWLVDHWVQANRLPRGEAIAAFVAMGAVLATRLGENVYRSALAGLQRQVELATSTIVNIALRTFGAAAILFWVSPTVTAFFAWQVLVSLSAIVVNKMLVSRFVAPADRPPRFSRSALHEVRTFSLGIFAITALGLALSHFDKFLLVKLSSLADYGAYSLAVMLANMVQTPVAPILQATMPRLTGYLSRGEKDVVADVYHDLTRLLMALAAPAALSIALYAPELVETWTRNAAVTQVAAPVLSIYVLGVLIAVATNLCYMLQIADGWTSLSLKLNLAIAMFTWPAIVVLTPRYGLQAAAAIWVVTNLLYLLVAPPLVHRRLLQGHMWRWYALDIAVPVCVSAVVVGLGRASAWGEAAPQRIVHAVAFGLLAIAVAALWSPRARAFATAALRRARRS